MPQYELMYLLGSHVADTDVPAITTQIQKFIADFGGTNVVEEQLGKKKLAYPIKKTRNGHYVVVNFSMDTKKINELDAKIHTQDSTIIRYLLLNLDEHLERTEKDKAAAAKMTRRIPVEENSEALVPATKKNSTPKLEEIDEKALDEKIEAALSEDVTK